MTRLRLTLAACLLAVSAATAGAQPAEFRGVKLTNVDSDVLFSDRAIEEAMDWLASIGINAVLPVVWNSSGAEGSMTLYPSVVMDTAFGRPIHPRFVGRDPLRRVVIEAHRNGIEVLPWFEMGFSTSYSQSGGYILRERPHWAALGADGLPVVKNGFDWMSGTHPEVQAFLRALAAEVADRYDIDGIEYSDRIPAMPVEAGYDPATVAIYREEHGGQDPPSNPRDYAWIEWRADRLTRFFADVRDAVRAHGDHLTVAASPSLWPWSLLEYLQDPPTWVREGIADHVIPQLYRYTLADYLYELDRSTGNYPGFRDRYFAGMLVRVGSYLIPETFFRASIEANRSRGVQGEVFFFYEGLRANGGHLGDILRTEFYTEPAIVPGREGRWRPPATVLQESAAATTGAWAPVAGIGSDGSALQSRSPDAAVEYRMEAPFAAWFDVFVYGIPDAGGTRSVTVDVTGRDGTETVTLDPTAPAFAGWQPVATVYVEQGAQAVVRMRRAGSDTAPMTVDAAMMMINRKRSPDTVVPVRSDPAPPPIPTGAGLDAWPNPSAGPVTVRYVTTRPGPVRIEAFDLLGRRVAVVEHAVRAPGTRHVTWQPDGLPPGVYVLRLDAPGFRAVRPVALVR